MTGLDRLAPILSGYGSAKTLSTRDPVVGFIGCDEVG
jgi:hypothetical protein